MIRKRACFVLSLVVTSFLSMSALSMSAFAQTAKSSAGPSLDPYVERMKVMIKRHWNPPADSRVSRVVVAFVIGSSGELTNLRISHSSGVAVKDAAALEAVKKTAPFEMLPKGSPKEVTIEFSFDYDPKLTAGEPKKDLQPVIWKGATPEPVNLSGSAESK